MSAHKTPASALAPPKHTSHTLLEQSPRSSIKKRKKKEDLVIATETDPDDTSAGFKRSTKKAKVGFHDDNDVDSSLVTKLKSEKKKKTKGGRGPSSEAVKPKGKSGEKEAVKEKKGKQKQAEPVISEGEDQDNAVGGNEQNSSSSDSEQDDSEYIPPVHESLARAPGPDSTSSSKKNKKHVPPDETPDQRDSRTIFVGNVPSQVMNTKAS